MRPPIERPPRPIWSWATPSFVREPGGCGDDGSRRARSGGRACSCRRGGRGSRCARPRRPPPPGPRRWRRARPGPGWRWHRARARARTRPGHAVMSATSSRHRLHAPRSGATGRAPTARAGQRGEEVAEGLDPLEHLGGEEAELLRAAGCALCHLLPAHRRGHARHGEGPQRVGGDRRLGGVVLAPVDEHLARAQVAAHVGEHLARMLALGQLGDLPRRAVGLLPGPGRVQTGVELQALGAARLRRGRRGPDRRGRRAATAPPGSTRRSWRAHRGRGRTR